MQLYRRMKDETAGAMVENVIVLPLVFVIIIFMIVSAFLIHDRTTIEAAAKRGAIYASHCISDPNYASLVGQSGDLDFSRSPESINFASVGQNIDAYRYIVGGASVQNVVEEEVKKISTICEIKSSIIMQVLVEKEFPRVRKFDGGTLVVIDVPYMKDRSIKNKYVTYPLGIIICDSHFIVTVSLVEHEFLKKAIKKIKVGEKVLAIGNPFGFSGTLTQGIISRID